MKEIVFLLLKGQRRHITGEQRALKSKKLATKKQVELHNTQLPDLFFVLYNPTFS